MAHPRPTSLRRKLIAQIALMIAGPLLIGSASLWGISAIHQDVNTALTGYRELREIYQVGFHVAAAREALHAQPANRHKALQQMQAALKQLDLFASGTPDPAYWLREAGDAVDDLRSAIRDSIARLDLPADDSAFGSPAAMQLSSVEHVLGQLVNLSAQIPKAVADQQEIAYRQRRNTLYVVLALSSLVVAAGVAAGVFQFFSVLRPLDRLAAAARTIASGKLSDRVEVPADREFASLAEDFNLMAARLEEIYRDLEQKVQAKSKQLVRSERLAGVGYLAAGVAHEINNPLSIIAGYGERSLRQLEPSSEDAPPGSSVAVERTVLEQAVKALRIICEESFRCKGITEQLLSLSRPLSQTRRPLRLDELAGRAIAAVQGMEKFSGRAVSLETAGDCTISGSESQLKQAILNLLVNALEALPPGAGQVRVIVRYCPQSLDQPSPAVELSVQDDGRGMTLQTLERVFEPFYTEKTDKRSEQPGTGLGLSITHAIVVDHAGQITAHSPGPGLGATFTIRLPAEPGKLSASPNSAPAASSSNFHSSDRSS